MESVDIASAESLLQFLATLCCAIFAGAAVYITLVEHPARLDSGPTTAVAEFIPSYRRAAAMQVPLALIGSLAAIGAWIVSEEVPWLVGALLLLAVVPYTLLFIAGTTKRLQDPALDRASPEASDLLRRWGRLHAIRSVLSVAALWIFLLA